ncbi:MmgE/PrpD family protein [Kipferlia bialata]|uniref:MmgE/PrpD family protein n=1 Tax=Kipferlia bialata TaxID=797122 RepID=A0A9K3GI03_9EUKA|nr:MmgE/PrpD family protein [Kipferlia bialata]|eukprot:g5241.t1
MPPSRRRTSLVNAYAHAVSEQNASANVVVTAPTCGSCGVLPAVLVYLKDELGLSDCDIINAIAVAGLVGNVAKANSSISGAEVGCQGEVGVATSMAAAAAAYLMGGGPQQIETAAESALEHQLGLICDPVHGKVIVPCIERNGHAALRALDCADLALMGEGNHLVSYDECVHSMKLSGLDMHSRYKETSEGGLALTFDMDQRVLEDKLRRQKQDDMVAERREIIREIAHSLRHKQGTRTPPTPHPQGQ